MILADCRPRAGAEPSTVAALLPDELAAMRSLAAAGTLVSAWTLDRPGALLLLDTDRAGAERVVADLPLARASLLEADLQAVTPVPLRP